MQITIRKIARNGYGYFAYVKLFSDQGTHFLYFEDDIFGALALNNFIDMLRNHYKIRDIKLSFHEKNEITLKNECILELLRSG